jgi:hypothetical protein
LPFTPKEQVSLELRALALELLKISGMFQLDLVSRSKFRMAEGSWMPVHLREYRSWQVSKKFTPFKTMVENMIPGNKMERFELNFDFHFSHPPLLIQAISRYSGIDEIVLRSNHEVFNLILKAVQNNAQAESVGNWAIITQYVIACKDSEFDEKTGRITLD